MTYITRLFLLCLFTFPITAFGQQEAENVIDEIEISEFSELEEAELIFESEPEVEGGFLEVPIEGFIAKKFNFNFNFSFGNKRDVFVYLHDNDIYRHYGHHYSSQYSNELSFTVDGDENFTQELQEDQNWYEFSLPKNAGEDVMLSLGDETHFIQLPEGNSPIYISILSEHLFPAGVEIWTREDIINGIRDRKTEIRGKFPIQHLEQKDIPEHIYLHLPFTTWEGSQDVYKTPLKGDIDWMTARFELEVNPIFTSIGFIQYGDLFYPMLISPHDYYRLEWKQAEHDPTLLDLTDRERQHYHGVRAQDFLSHRYAHGMSKDAYKQLVNALMGNRESRMDTLIAWSRAIVPFYEENHSNPERFLTHINSIGQRSWKDLFDRAYDERQDIRRRNGYDEVKEYSAVLLVGFLLSLILFGVGVYLRQTGSKFFNTKTLEKIEWTFHAFFWSFLMIEIMPRTHSGYVELPGIAMWIIFIGSIVLFTVNWRILASRFLLKRRWGKYVLSVAGLGLIYIALNITQALNPFLRNTFALVDGSWYVTDYPFEWHPSPSFEDLGMAFVIMMLIAPLYAILRHIVLNGIPRLRAQKEALNAELNTLKTQISPHFFFNSLNTVYGFALTEESPRTAEAITKLSDLMRFAIYHGDKKQIPLETELEYLSDYIDMQRLRINPIKHDLQYRVDGEANDLQIAPLMLITLIENAFKHGISMSQESYIHIDLFILDKGLILTVENSVHPKDLVAVGGNAVIKESGVGLVNTRERLNLLYSGKHEWRIEEDEDRYFTQLSLDLAE